MFQFLTSCNLYSSLVKLNWGCVILKLDTPGINMDEAMRMLLMEAMAQYPSQSANPHYESTSFPDDYCKVIMKALAHSL
jgi:hypothetical protein